jgi:hypothetical protein
MDDGYSGSEPTLGGDRPNSGLAPTTRPGPMQLDGLTLTQLATVDVGEEPIFVVPTPQAGRVVLGWGQGPYHYETLDMQQGARQALALPSELALSAIDARGRYYLMPNSADAVVRMVPGFQPEMTIALAGARQITVGPDYRTYAWLFKSRTIEVYGPDGALERVVPHDCSPYSFAVDGRGAIWLGEASFSHVFELDPFTGSVVGCIDPKEDYLAENLFCYTYEMTFDRKGNLWTYNGQGDHGMTILDRDKTKYIRFASKDVDPGFADSKPIPSPWTDEFYLVSPSGMVASYHHQLLHWKPVTADIHGTS